jgi:hypothetical protein
VNGLDNSPDGSSMAAFHCSIADPPRRQYSVSPPRLRESK